MKLQSHTITQGHDRAPARAMLKAIGFTDEDLAKPIIGVANTWIETMPCNYTLRALAKHVKDGIRAAGATPMGLNTVALSARVIASSGGDKTIPGTVMALARLDLPSLMLYGGSIRPGHFQGRDVTI